MHKKQALRLVVKKKTGGHYIQKKKWAEEKKRKSLRERVAEKRQFCTTPKPNM
jgi:hypothetical protein